MGIVSDILNEYMMFIELNQGVQLEQVFSNQKMFEDSHY